MRRSEMVNALFCTLEELEGHTSSRHNLIELMSFAEEALKLCEEFGMMPPARYSDTKLGVLEYAWEPEKNWTSEKK